VNSIQGINFTLLSEFRQQKNNVLRCIFTSRRETDRLSDKGLRLLSLNLWLWSTWRYECFEAFDWPIRR